jgi:hypothetical protein
LCGYISDFKSVEICDWALEGISLIENEEAVSIDRSSNNFIVEFSKPHVTIDFALADAEDLDWPIWKFSLIEVKTALLGWKAFLEMPMSENQQLEIDLG